MEKNRNYFRFCQFILACLITVVGFGQQTVFTLNSLRSTNQYLTLDSTTNTLGILSSGQTHTIQVGTLYGKFKNISVINLVDSAIVTHNLNTIKVDVSFFEQGLKENGLIDYYPISNNAIVVYLPRRDKPIQKKFTGEIFITKR